MSAPKFYRRTCSLCVSFQYEEAIFALYLNRIIILPDTDIPPLIDVNWFHETLSIEIRRLTNPVLESVLLFIVGSIISPIVFKNLKNVVKNREY
jgi:hypothetical protein